ncbi:MAG: ATP-grasp domain-containing protein [Eubacterium sp.]|nr:ATP-grasp domain-containing protein [Eubacterium sp.]
MKNENKPVAIVLGGIYPHGAALDKLKKRGYHTILIDYFDNPPAAVHADEHRKESAMDEDMVLQIAKETNAKLVVSPCLDQQLMIAMKVSEKLGLPHPFDSQTAVNVTNKKYMKKMMLDHGIPTARHYQVGTDTDLSNLAIDYPLVVKPVDCCGSAGVTRVEVAANLEEAVREACQWSWSSEAIVEEFKTGREINVYTYVKDGKARLVTTLNRVSYVSGKEIRYYGGISPASLSDAVRKRIEEIATKVAQVFGLNTTPLFLQVMVGKGGSVDVIEFSPRLGGGTCYYLMEHNAGFDMLEASIDSYLHLDNDQEPRKEKSRFLIYQLQAHECVFDHLEGVDILKEKGLITECFYQKTKGMAVTTEKVSSSRVAALLVEGSGPEECFLRLQEIMKVIKVIDDKGKDVTDRSLVLGIKDMASVTDEG